MIDGHWLPSYRSDERAISLYLRHYSAKRNHRPERRVTWTRAGLRAGDAMSEQPEPHGGTISVTEPFRERFVHEHADMLQQIEALKAEVDEARYLAGLPPKYGGEIG